ncbi:SDR family oxidoreductase [Kitasatospora sp. NPDC101155]|uniref:SDR family oxidoreductase n=1 Tax=Kitasatospora sp. NPDC101155 TaxID=3364097 RepID=UPI0037FA257C
MGLDEQVPHAAPGQQEGHRQADRAAADDEHGRSLGIIDTARQRAVHADSDTGQPYDQWATEWVRRRGVPLGRMGRPEEVAPVIALLASPLASYISGAEVTVAGGAGRSAH